VHLPMIKKTPTPPGHRPAALAPGCDSAVLPEPWFWV